MTMRIINKLKSIEKKNDVTILYACESGSRAWGFDNDESDWDVRFIYKRNNVRDYLTLTPKKEVIEYMEGELDIVGWDIKKSLFLHYKNNPNLREWIISPVKYIDFKENLFEGLPDFDPSVLKYHYSSIAVNNWKKLRRDDLKLTKRDIKMFLYNCRCILIWQVLERGGNPSINIHELLNQAKNLDEFIKDNIIALIDYYKNNCEDTIDLDVIKAWMDLNIRIMKNDLPEKETSRDVGLYNERFFDIIMK